MPSPISPIVKIESVDCSLDSNALIDGGGLELPTSGWLDASYSFPVQGWIVGKEQEVTTVRVLDEFGMRLDMPVRLPRPDVVDSPRSKWPRECGFASRVNTADLPSRFRVKLAARFEKGAQSPIAVIEGTRRSLPVQGDARFQPITVTTLGRSGSTWLLSLLGRHPNIVVFQAQGNETRAASYFIDVLRTLSRPSSYVAALRGYRVSTADWTGATAARPLREYERDPALRDWLGTTYVEELIRFATQRIDALYEQLSAREGKGKASHFAEKSGPNGPQMMLSEIYPRAREILLVRDFRDYVCSVRSWRHGWEEDRSRFPSEAEWIKTSLGGQVRALLASWRSRPDKALLVKYEDLVMRTQETIASVFKHVGTDASSEIVDFVIEEDRAKSDKDRERCMQTSGGPVQSMGRWRTELDPTLVRACEEAFGPALEEFGYV